MSWLNVRQALGPGVTYTPRKVLPVDERNNSAEPPGYAQRRGQALGARSRIEARFRAG